MNVRACPALVARIEKIGEEDPRAIQQALQKSPLTDDVVASVVGRFFAQACRVLDVPLPRRTKARQVNITQKLLVRPKKPLTFSITESVNLSLMSPSMSIKL